MWFVTTHNTDRISTNRILSLEKPQILTESIILKVPVVSFHVLGLLKVSCTLFITTDLKDKISLYSPLDSPDLKLICPDQQLF